MSNTRRRKASEADTSSAFVRGTMPWPALDTGTRPHVRPGSQTEPIVRLVYAETRRCGYGISSKTIADALRAEGWAFHLPVKVLVTALASRGVLFCRGTGKLRRYTPPGFVEINTMLVRGDAEIVYDALCLVAAEWRSMVPTLAISQKIKQSGWTLASNCVNAVGKRLETLSRMPSRPKRAITHPPMVRRERVASTGGAAALFWAPVDAPHLALPADSVSNGADAARSVIRRLQGAAGRPVSRSEIRLLIRTLEENHPIRYFLPPHKSGRSLMRALSRCVQTDFEDRTDTACEGILARAYESKYSVAGGAPPRYFVAPFHAGADPRNVFDEAALAALLVDEIVYTSGIDYELLALSDGTKGISAVDAKIIEPWLCARTHGSSAVTALISAALNARARRRVGLHSPRTAVGEQESRLIAGTELLNAGDRHLIALADSHAPGFLDRAITQRDGIRVRLQRRRRALPILCAALRDLPIADRSPAEPNLVGGERTAVAIMDIAPWADGYTEDDFRSAVAGCRRFPVEGAPPRTRAARFFSHALQIGTLDRAEALTALGDLVQDAWTRGMLKRAYECIGWTTRATAVFGTCVQDCVSAKGVTPSLRRRMLVAGGLLGTEATIEATERLLRSASERMAMEDVSADVRAAFLAAALVSPEHAAALLASPVCKAMTGTLAERVTKAARRLRTGHILAVSAP